MSLLRHIRKDLFNVTQAEFGLLAGVTQATVSRWEDGQLIPDLTELERIRSAALTRGLEWDDSVFFTAPSPAPAAKAVA